MFKIEIDFAFRNGIGLGPNREVKAMSKGFLRQENLKRDSFPTGNYTLEIRREVVHLHSLFLLAE